MLAFLSNKKPIPGTATAVRLASRIIFFFVSLRFYCAMGQDIATSPSTFVRVTDDSSSATAKSCTMKALEKRVLGSHPRHLIFNDIDMAVGFNVVPQSLEVEFTLVVPTQGWVGFGISEVGSMKGADIAVIEPQDNGSFVLTDRYSKNFVEPTIDKVQNWELLNAEHESILIEACDSEPDLLRVEEVSITTLVIRRMLDTCDAEDEPLTPDFFQNYFIAAYGENHHKKLQYHSKRASIAEYVHVPEPLVPRDPKGKSVFDIVSPPIEVPSGVTNYCYSRVTIDRPVAVTAYSAINTKNLHHFHLVKVTEALTFEGDYVCGEGQMGVISLSWGTGTGLVVLPGDLYTKLEPGEYYLESHFENLDGNGFEASPGYRIYAHEDESQLNDKGEIQVVPLSAWFQTPIPAGHSHAEKGFELPSACLEDLPSEGVTVMASVAHMHTYGLGMQIYRTRGDRNDLVFEQRVFDFNKQNPIWKSWTIIPGDRVYWKCIWDTSSTKDPVPWGTSIEDEMCMAILVVTKGLPFRYVSANLGLEGKTYTSCDVERLDFDYEEHILAQLTDPKEDVVLVEIDPTPPQEAFIEKGRDRNICQELVRAEIVPPPNNWLLGSPIYLIVIAWIIQIVGRRAISAWCHHFGIQRDELWFSEKSIMFMEMVSCSVVLFLVLSNYDFNFSVETNEIYEVAGEEPLGYQYASVLTATDFLACSYIVTIIVKAALQINFLYDAIHHGCAILAMMLLVNATDFVYAPSFIFFFGSCMLLHASATAPVFLFFLLLKLNPDPSKYSNKPLAVIFIILSVIKQLVMIAAHVASIMNYRLFFLEETFRLEEVTEDWNHKPYFESRMTKRELLMNLPWLEMLKYVLPFLWIILACVQFYMTKRQLQIGIYEYKKTYDNEHEDVILKGKGKRHTVDVSDEECNEESTEAYLEEHSSRVSFLGNERDSLETPSTDCYDEKILNYLSHDA